MKINFVLLSTAKGGGTRVIFEVANGLAKRGHQIKIISLDKPKHHWANLSKNIDIQYPENKYFMLIPGYGRIPFFAIFRKIFNFLKLPYDVDRIKLLAKSIPDADITIATEFPTAYAVFFNGKGKMFYYIQHDESTFPSNPIESRFALSSYHLPLKHLVVSHWLEDLIGSRVNKHPIHIGNAVNSEIFKPSSIKEKDTVMGFIRGIEWKGDKDMLTAFALAQEKNENIKFKIVDPKKLLKKLIKDMKIELRNLEVLESHTDKDLCDFYSSSNVFVFASHLEGFGLPPLEAMASGTPVVTTDSLGVRDFVVNDFNSLVVPIKNPEKISEAILKILESSNLSEKLRKNGLKTASEFNWEGVIDNLEIILKNETK